MFLKISQYSLENNCADLTPAQMFSSEYWPIFKNSFFIELLEWLLLEYKKSPDQPILVIEFKVQYRTYSSTSLFILSLFFNLSFIRFWQDSFFILRNFSMKEDQFSKHSIFEYINTEQNTEFFRLFRLSLFKVNENWHISCKSNSFRSNF